MLLHTEGEKQKSVSRLKEVNEGEENEGGEVFLNAAPKCTLLDFSFE